MTTDTFNKLANRFCVWPLPDDVCADPCATYADHPHPRHGTNLLTVAQAEQMLRFILAGEHAFRLVDHTGEPCFWCGTSADEADMCDDCAEDCY